MSSRVRGWCGRRGMTLLELLIAVGIIGMLAGIVMAATAGARECAHIGTCMSNLHQLHLALTMYVADHGGRPETDMPGRLPMLYPAYVPDPRVFVCPSLFPDYRFPCITVMHVMQGNLARQALRCLAESLLHHGLTMMQETL